MSASAQPRTIVFLDVDGTLVNYRLDTPPSAVPAIRQARSLGHQVVLTTGRSRAEMPQDIWDIGFDGMIGGNGMYVEFQGEVLHDRALAADLTSELVEWMQSRRLGFYLESRNGLFANEYLLPEAARVIHGENTKEHRDTVSRQLHGVAVVDQLHRDDVAKISFVLGHDDYRQAQQEFGDRVKISTWSATGKGPEFGEFALPGVDKIHAINDLLATLEGIERTVAIGDAASDQAMIEAADVGIAVGNGEEKIKQVADLVVPDVDDDGLAIAFAQLGIADSPADA